jgi:hypothetical protein
MGRILLLLAGLAVLALPAAAAAGSQAHGPTPGFLVVHNASTDGDPFTGKSVATVVVRGFVLGHIAQQGAVRIFNLESGGGSNAAVVTGVEVSRVRRPVYCCDGKQQGVLYRGSDFRFRVVGGSWLVVVYGSGISLYAGGIGSVSLHGSVFAPRADGRYSFNGGRFRSLPPGVVEGKLEKK